MLSLLLGTRWSVRLDPKMSLVLQFLLLGISFDALRRFYVSTLNLLAPESAIRQIVRVSSAQICRIGRAAEKVVAIQVVANGAPSKMDQTLHAQTIVRTRYLKDSNTRLRNLRNLRTVSLLAATRMRPSKPSARLKLSLPNTQTYERRA